MNILMVASEAAPFLRTGDVANVVTGLSLELRRQGHDVRIAIPHYRSLVLTSELQTIVDHLEVPLGDYTRQAKIVRTDTPLPVYLIDNEFYFGRADPYGYLDDYERFIFFTRAVLEMLHPANFSAQGWHPDVIHGHDWATGLMPMWMRQNQVYQNSLASTTFVYTLHNAGFQGKFGYRAIAVAELAELGIYDSLGESISGINFMVRGILAADAVNTVSPTHASEIAQREYADNLSMALKQRDTPLTGILNGIDYEFYDPAFDEQLEQRFNLYNFDRHRSDNKRVLQKECGLIEDPDVLLIGMVTRLATDKGLGLVESVLPQLFAQYNVQLVIMGNVGDYRYRESLGQAQSKFPGKLAVYFSYDEARARHIFGGCDLLLIPSRYEPCGPQQMIAMRYGAIPLVYRTGGLADTVTIWDAVSDANSRGKGFIFDTFDPSALVQAIINATTLFRSDRMKWQTLQRANMALDFSWSLSAHQYIKLYENAIQTRNTRLPLPTGKPIEPELSDLLASAILEASELAMSTDWENQLKQGAQLARELLKCDAVLIWIQDEAFSHRLQLAEYSFARNDMGASPILDKYDYREFVDQDQRSLQRVYHLPDDEASRPINQLAAERCWQYQMTVPISTHDSLLGRIDTYSSTHEFSERDVTMLGAFAHGLALSLARINANTQYDALLAADRDMASAQSLEDLFGVALEWAIKLTHADAGCFYEVDEEDKHLHKRIFQGSSDIWPDSITTGEGAAGKATSQAEVVLVLDEAWNPDSSSRQMHSSELAVAVRRKDRLLGVLNVLSYRSSAFTRDDEQLLYRFSTQIAHAVGTAQEREAQLARFQRDLGRLSNVLAGSNDISVLMGNIVNTIGEVLQVDAATLYLADEKNQRLDIQAAYGYQTPLVEAKAFYKWGEGVTGWIAQTNQAFGANSLDGLRDKGDGKQGKYDHLQDNKRPTSFYGLPLNVTGRDKPIGVLKVESLRERPFTGEDVLLIQMMGNVIATVVYNAQLSEQRLRELNTNLGQLSRSLAGSNDRQVLMDNIVNTIGEVLKVDAATLYLADEKNQRLIIQAAYGYQKPLVAAKAFYEWEEGVTGWIAQTNESFGANSLDVLCNRRGSPHGKYDHLQDNKRPTSFYGLPLNVTGRDKPIGVLKVESLKERPFTSEDVLLIEMMSNVVATVVYNAQLSEQHLRELNTNLAQISRALAGSNDMSVLMKNIMNTIGEVLKVDAATLYLADEKNQRLNIQAAYGYQEPLMAAKAFYDWGKGVTGRIAETNQPFRANSLDGLRKEGGSEQGKYDHLQGGKRPASFYGVPLNVKGRDKPIGVLKVESLQGRLLTSEDVLLIEMMGNVVATVVYNAQLSEQRLRELNTNLGQLSRALAGSNDRQMLMDNIVNTIAEVLRVDAATLYLADEKNQRLDIQAAYGYLKPLVAAKAFYEWGEGVTGRIAQTNMPFGANSLDVLRKEGGSEKGKYDHLQGNKRPTSFYGLPLNIKGRDKPIGVLKVESLKARPFTNEDVLLIQMMGNVIATVVYNAQLNQARLARILESLGSVAKPSQQAALTLLSEFAQSKDRGDIQLLAASLENLIAGDIEKAYEEAAALSAVYANPVLFSQIAETTPYSRVAHRFSLFYDAARNPQVSASQLNRVLTLSHQWVYLEEAPEDNQRFQAMFANFAQTFSEICQAVPENLVNSTGWTGLLLDTSRTFENTYLPTKLPLVVHRRGYPVEEDLPELRRLLSTELEDRKQVVLPLWCDDDVMKRTQEMLRQKLQQPFSIDAVVLNIKQLQQITSAARPDIALQRAVLAQINLMRVSPYQSVGPTTERIFFGREDELRQVSDKAKQTSFAFIGGRRIGKTSILYQLQRVRLPAIGFRTLYFTCESVRYEDFMATRIRDWQPDRSAMPKTISELLASPPTGKPLVLLLDEADKLVPDDRERGWPFFKTLRAMANSSEAQLVLSGESTLLQALNDDQSPLFNFANKVVLGPLDFRAVEELITSPMKQLDIEFADQAAVVKRIYDFTSGHPNVVQRLCIRLVKCINDREKRRIALDDVAAVVQDPEFLKEDFLDTYWASATQLEKIISLLMTNDGDLHSSRAIKKVLADRYGLSLNVSEINKALQRLVNLRLILKHTSDGYEFAVSAFPHVIAGTMTLEDTLDELIEEYGEKADGN